MRRIEVSAIVGAVVLALATSDLAAQETHVCLIDDEAFATANGGCHDLATGLVWSRKKVGICCGGWSWESAVQFCEDADEGGYTDWLLPTLEALETVHANGAPTHFNWPDTSPGSSFWSSKKQGIWAWSNFVIGSGESNKHLIGSGLLWACVRVPSACGNGTCDDQEDVCSCPSDCGTPAPESECTDGVDNDCDTLVDCDDPDCAGDAACTCDDDGVCETDEDQCNCPFDCGDPPSNEADCSDGLDEDCDGDVDCDDADCDDDEACACLPKRATCHSNSDCCSNNCNYQAVCGGGNPN